MTYLLIVDTHSTAVNRDGGGTIETVDNNTTQKWHKNPSQLGTKDKEQGLRNTPERNNMAAERTFTPVAM